MAAEIDLPALKVILWHKMRDDLKPYLPEIVATRHLLCPTCCRPLPFESFSLEHIIPLQSLAEDPLGARSAIPKNMRTSTTLLCNKPLLIKGVKFYNNGCNSWKGKFYDTFLKEIFNSSAIKLNRFSARHHTALASACYLGLFEKFGYQVALTSAGLLMRKQFFNPKNFIKEMPLKYQISLMGSAPKYFDRDEKKYWDPPFEFEFDGTSCLVIVRNTGMYIPVSRDPNIPLAHNLPFVPSKFKLRPNFETVFT